MPYNWNLSSNDLPASLNKVAHSCCSVTAITRLCVCACVGVCAYIHVYLYIIYLFADLDADDVNILAGSIHTLKENAEALVAATREIGLEVNDDKTKYMVMPRDQNARRIQS